MGRRKRKDGAQRRFGDGPSAFSKATILRDLGRSIDESPIFSLPSPLLPWGAAISCIPLVVFAPAFSRMGPVGVVLSLAIVLAALAVFLFPRKLIIGDDGLLLVWIGSKFIRYREIDYLETAEGLWFHHPQINIVLKDGRAVDFTTSIFKERWAERDALISLIRIYVEEAGRKRAQIAPTAITRAGRTHATWARALRAIGSGAHFDTRAAAVPTDDLLRIAESPYAQTTDRAAAFVALAATKDDEIVRRLRIACDHTVAPDVRPVLRTALESTDDDEEIGRVLQEAERSTTQQ